MVKTPGYDFEERFAKLVGGTIQPKSGAGPHKKLDVVSSQFGGHKFLWSCKHTDYDSFSVTKYHISEAVDAVQNTGSASSIDTIPGMAIEMNDFVIVSLRFEDFAQIIEATPSRDVPSKARARHLASKVPPLLRNE